MPIVSCLLSISATISFVPTPSVPETKTGLSYLSRGISNIAPNPPKPANTPGRVVDLAMGLIFSMSLFPLVISTPESL